MLENRHAYDFLDLDYEERLEPDLAKRQYFISYLFKVEILVALTGSPAHYCRKVFNQYRNYDLQRNAGFYQNRFTGYAPGVNSLILFPTLRYNLEPAWNVVFYVAVVFCRNNHSRSACARWIFTVTVKLLSWHFASSGMYANLVHQPDLSGQHDANRVYCRSACPTNFYVMRISVTRVDLPIQLYA